jgi:hypothetical protein
MGRRRKIKPRLPIKPRLTLMSDGEWIVEAPGEGQEPQGAWLEGLQRIADWLPMNVRTLKEARDQDPQIGRLFERRGKTCRIARRDLLELVMRICLRYQDAKRRGALKRQRNSRGRFKTRRAARGNRPSASTLRLSR